MSKGRFLVSFEVEADLAQLRSRGPDAERPADVLEALLVDLWDDHNPLARDREVVTDGPVMWAVEAADKDGESWPASPPASTAKRRDRKARRAAVE